MKIKREIRSLLDRVQEDLSGWLPTAMAAATGHDWFPREAKSALSEIERSRIDSGDWSDVMDLDLQAMLKITRYHRRRLKKAGQLPEETGYILNRMCDVRNTYVGHSSTREPNPREAAKDVSQIVEFCLALDFHSSHDRAKSLEAEIWRCVVGPEGENKARETATDEGPKRLRDAFPAHPALTPSQSCACDELELFFDSAEPCFVLNGYAGTGKTFLIDGLVRYLETRKRNIVLLAPTGRAASLLTERFGWNATTIHRAIYALDEVVEKRPVQDVGQAEFMFTFELRDNEHEEGTVFIVDEASMVSDKDEEQDNVRFGSGRLLADLVEFIGFRTNEKLIVVGDHAQLPPVGMNFSPALNPDYLSESFKLDCRGAVLTDIARQAKAGGILRNATQIRDLLHTGRFVGFVFDDASADTEHLNDVRFLDSYLAHNGTNPKDDCMLVAFSNDSANEYNKRIRSHFFPDNTSLRCGDRIIVTKNNFSYGRSLFNGQVGQVEWAAEAPEERQVFVNLGTDATGKRITASVSLRYRDVELSFACADGTRRTVNCAILDNLLEPQSRDDLHLLAKAQYVEFTKRHPGLRPGTPDFAKTLRDDNWFNALQIRYGYAVTCHKAQGGEWDHVFVDCQGRDRLAEEPLRWTYTAFTRAKTKLYVTNVLNSPVLRPKVKPPAETASAQTDAESTEGDLAHPEFWTALRTRLQAEGMDVRFIRTFSEYHSRYQVERGGSTCSMDYWFNKKGKFTKVGFHKGDAALGDVVQKMHESM